MFKNQDSKHLCAKYTLPVCYDYHSPFSLRISTNFCDDALVRQKEDINSFFLGTFGLYIHHLNSYDIQILTLMIYLDIMFTLRIKRTSGFIKK